MITTKLHFGLRKNDPLLKHVLLSIITDMEVTAKDYQTAGETDRAEDCRRTVRRLRKIVPVLPRAEPDSYFGSDLGTTVASIMLDLADELIKGSQSKTGEESPDCIERMECLVGCYAGFFEGLTSRADS